MLFSMARIGDKLVATAAHRNAAPSSVAGFTLLELLVALVLVAILASLAVPTFETSVQRTRHQAGLNNVIGMLSLARGEAVSRSVPVTVCVSADAATCDGAATTWESGWLVFEDNGAGGGTARNGKREAGEELINIGEPARRTISIRTVNFPSGRFVTFDPVGMVGSRGTFVVCDERGTTHASALVLNISGQARLAQDNVGGDDIVEDDAGNAVGCPA
jgi:type IV fimbrial biogenesis protein FimT